MIWEILIIFSLAGIFIILLRRLPEVVEADETSSRADFKFEEALIGDNETKIKKSPITEEKKTSEYSEELALSETAQKTDARQVQADNLLDEAEKLFQEKKYRQAEERYIQAAALDPDNAKIYNRLGAIYLEQKSFRDAREAFHTALRLDPTIPSRNVNLGLAYLGMKNYNEALSYFEKAYELDPANGKYHKLAEDTKAKIS